MGRFHSRALFRVLSFATIACFLGESARAYTPTISPEGKQIQWKDALKLMLAGNPKNRNGITEQAFRDSVVRGLQRWKYASKERVDFDYWQGSDPTLFPASSDYDGVSAIYFSSAAQNSPANGNIIGLTQVWYDTASGKILETDITLNDVNFQLTTNPRDTTSNGSNRVFIENIITHEIGHAFGLSHSANVQSTMLYVEGPEQAFLSCDEQTAIRALYGAPLSLGSITGRVRTSSGTAVFGAQVVAISSSRGAVLGTALTRPGGDFAIEGLEAGTYYLMVEPYYSSASSLPSYFSSINSSSVCGGSPFGRTVIASSSGIATPFALAAGGSTATGDLVVTCGTSGSAAVPAIPGSSDFATAPIIYSGQGSEFGVADRITASSSRAFYRINGVAGNFQARVLSYSLYSSSKITMRLLDQFGNSVSGVTATAPIYTGVSGFINHDASISAPSLAPGNYVLELTQQERLGSSAFPGGSVALDAAPFFVLAASLNPSVSSDYPANARCRMDENFPSYSSPGGGPPKNGFTERPADSGSGFCGSVRSNRGSGDGGGPPAMNASQMIGWFLPWVLMLVGLGLRRQWLWGLRRLAQASILRG